MSNEAVTIGDEPMNDDTANDGPGYDETANTLPPPLPPQQKTPWWHVRVSREPEGRKLAGVVGGIARAYGFDVRTTRIAVAIATLVLPALIVVYVAAWLMLPARPEEAVPLRDVVTDRRKLPLLIALGIVLVVFGVGSFGSWFLFGGFGWGFALIAIGVVLWAAPNLGSSTSASTNGSTTTSTYASPPVASGIVAPATATQPASPPQPRRRRYPVQAISIVIAAVVSLIAGIGDALDWWNTNVFGITIVVLAILIVGALVSSIVNRSWLAACVALMLLPVTTFLLIARPNLDGGIGERTVVPTTIAEASEDESLAIGSLTMDLTQVPLDGETLSTSVDVGFGEITVRVPDDAVVHLETFVGAGVVTLDGRDIVEGMRHHDERTLPPSGEGESRSGVIELDLEVGAGSIVVERVSS